MGTVVPIPIIRATVLQILASMKLVIAIISTASVISVVTAAVTKATTAAAGSRTVNVKDANVHGTLLPTLQVASILAPLILHLITLLQRVGTNQASTVHVDALLSGVVNDEAKTLLIIPPAYPADCRHGVWCRRWRAEFLPAREVVLTAIPIAAASADGSRPASVIAQEADIGGPLLATSQVMGVLGSFKLDRITFLQELRTDKASAMDVDAIPAPVWVDEAKLLVIVPALHRANLARACM
mmetsp:Transcript_136699/g.380941  ORF Transcript_136699/g.380941 Transcript_136699/m.380941 type:complete len:241 (-) Transcript_136699:551-1273(-)